jgi:acetyl esterase/lipase
MWSRTMKADLVVKAIQKSAMKAMGRTRPLNSFQPALPTATQMRDDGIVYVNDLAYGADYPNSFLDIWYPDGDRSRKRPVLINFHGGGFFIGDKVMGDPLAASTPEGFENSVNAMFLSDGFAVVCPTYALAPDFRFPVQVVQANQVLGFLAARADELALDMDRVVIMGGSAGAGLTEILGLVHTDPGYAKLLGVAPALSPKQIKGLLIDEAALTSRGVTDRNMHMLFQLWTGEKDPANSAPGELIDVPRHIRGAYPPAFINTSNMEHWFVDSAFDLHRALDRYGLPNEIFYRDQTVDRLEHGYLNRHVENATAAECLTRMRAFAQRVIQ